MSTSPPPVGNRPVTRADIEAKLPRSSGVTDETTEVAEGAAKTGLVIGGVSSSSCVAFLLGRRRGHKKSTIVEIRRI